LVTGDYGIWTFSRRFVPSAGEKVSVDYWVEKLQQEAYEFDLDAALKDYSDFKDEYTYKAKCMIEVLDQCQNTFEDKIEFITEIRKIYELLPTNLDIEFEDMPDGEKLKPQLEIVFSAFNEMCKREGKK
jgi:hypothetical protein